MLENKSASAAARQEEPSDEEFTKAGANIFHKTSTDIRNRKKLLDKLDFVPEQRAFIQKPVKLEPKDEGKKEPKSEVKEEDNSGLTEFDIMRKSLRDMEARVRQNELEQIAKDQRLAERETRMMNEIHRLRGNGHGRSEAAAASDTRTYTDRATADPTTKSDKETDAEKERRMRGLHRQIYQARLKEDGFLEPAIGSW